MRISIGPLFAVEREDGKVTQATASANRTYSRSEFWRGVAGLILFSAAFGYVEAAVVCYLRSIYTPLRAQFYSGNAGELFPLLSLEQLRTLGPEHVLRLKTELGRELATMLMLGGAALIAARNLRAWVAAFLLCFGVWDITFYLFLKVLIDWPGSLLTWDILFLIPVPWVGPVIAPVMVAASMVASALVVLWREHEGRPVQIRLWQTSLIVLGGAMIVIAFMWDFRNTAAGGNPNAFNWGLFLLGEAIGLMSFFSCLRRA